MAEVHIPDEAVTAIWHVLVVEGVEPPYMAKTETFTAAQIEAGELRAAEEEANRLNDAVMRKGLYAAAPHIDRAARVQELRRCADMLFGLARLAESGELTVADLRETGDEQADRANELEGSRDG